MVHIITIDGPAAAGKGTICKKLARCLDAQVLNSGEIFRSIAFCIKKNGIDYTDVTNIINFCKKFKYKKISSSKIYTSEIDFISSKTSKIPSIRKLAIKIQRNFVKLNALNSNIIIAEGRDMGTVVFPKAKVKIFIWAKAEIRAKRRMLQLGKSQKTGKFELILSQILARDLRDMTRKTAPLLPARDSYLIDNSNLDIEQCFNRILKIKRRILDTNK